MFEFAIAQQQKRKPGRRFLASVVASCLCHAAFLLVLIEYPQLLKLGTNQWLLQPIVTQSPAEEKEWRQVAVVGTSKMQQPPPEILRKYAYNWRELQGSGERGAPPVNLSWGNKVRLPREEEKKPPTRPAMGTEDTKTAQAGDPAASAVAPEPGAASGAAGTPSKDEKAATVYLPPPEPPKEPSRIPDKIADAGNAVRNPPAPPKQVPAETEKTEPKPPQAKPQARVFENEQAAIRTEGSGFFDTRGFPLGEYADPVIERVKGTWLIPSNLRNSQGRTTIIFFIGKDGQFVDARIVVPSGSASLDLAALSAVIESNPFPPLPQGFPGERVGAKFVFSYNERP